MGYTETYVRICMYRKNIKVSKNMKFLEKEKFSLCFFFFNNIFPYSIEF